MAQATAAAPVSETRVNTFMAQVYLLMSVGLAVTGLVAYWASNDQQFLNNLYTKPWFAFGLFILQIILVVVLSARVMTMSPGAAGLLFLFYAAVTGLALTSIFLIYSDEQIYSVFLLTSGVFLVTSLVGILLKRDMSSAGNYIFMILLGWMLMWFLSWLFNFSTFNWALNFIGIAIFVALTAWDAQQLKKIGQQIGSHPARGGLVVIGALKLYLDYINLFLLMLRASNR
jgi:FtsH-binding integral membrane protein